LLFFLFAALFARYCTFKIVFSYSAANVFNKLSILYHMYMITM